jgi:hypothetical protein
MAESGLVRRWHDALEGREELALDRENISRFDPLIERMSPPDLRAVPDIGCVMRDLGDGLLLEFEGSLVPAGATDAAEPVGVIRRFVDTSEEAAQHLDFGLAQEWQGERRGARAVCRHALLYRELGVQDVYLEATDAGSYYWASCGFDFNSSEDRETVVEAAAELFERLGFDDELDWVEHSWDFLRLEGETTGRDLLLAYEESEEWLGDLGVELDQPLPLGKVLLGASNHGGWTGHLDLRGESAGIVRLRDYGRCDEL